MKFFPGGRSRVAHGLLMTGVVAVIPLLWPYLPCLRTLDPVRSTCLNEWQFEQC